jgi:hypothetical protein
MKVGVSSLSAMLQAGVVEIKFRRRRNKPGWTGVRRMLCTNDLKLLNSMPGHIALNYRSPSHPPPYPATTKNLVCAWDLLWQDYRMINCNDCNAVTLIPTRTPEETQKFWEYFAESLAPMTSDQKEGFMNAS